MTRGCWFTAVLALFVVLLLPVLGPGPAVVPTRAGAQETTPEADPDCDDATEPNDEAVDAQELPETTACLTAEHDDAGQDFYLWTVSEDDAAQRWTIATTGLPNQAISINVFHSELDDAGVVVDQTALASADGGANEGTSLTNLLWPAGEYLIGVATSGAGTYQLTITAGDPTPDDDESEPNDDATTAQSVTGEFALTGDRTGTEDWYAWQIPNASEGQLWRLSAQFPLQGGGALRLYREDLTPLFDGGVGPDGRAVLDDIGLPAGTYLISVPSVTDAERHLHPRSRARGDGRAGR